jgi:hypothetical protein
MSDDAKWLDAPTEDGWWWRSVKGQASECGLVRAGRWSGPCNEWGASLAVVPLVGIMYWRAEEPPAPRWPLPKERVAKLTATVEHCRSAVRDCWHVQVFVDGIKQHVPDERGGSRESCVRYVRDTYGIEPEMGAP